MLFIDSKFIDYFFFFYTNILALYNLFLSSTAKIIHLFLVDFRWLTVKDFFNKILMFCFVWLNYKLCCVGYSYSVLFFKFYFVHFVLFVWYICLIYCLWNEDWMLPTKILFYSSKKDVQNQLTLASQFVYNFVK